MESSPTRDRPTLRCRSFDNGGNIKKPFSIGRISLGPLNPKPLNPKLLNPKPLNPKPLNPNP